MFELHIGDTLSVPFTAINSPLLLLGNMGQGRSTTLQKIVIDLIKNGQTGCIYDPYGDLTQAIKKGVISETYKNNFIIFDDSISESEMKKNIPHKFILIYSKKLQEGGRNIRQKAIGLIKKLQKDLQEGQWCLVDEAFEYLDDTILKNYFDLTERGVKVVFSDSTLINLSKDEREELIKNIDNFIVYKLRNIDAKWLEENNPIFRMKDIGAIQQYHYQFLHNGRMEYSASLWPIETL
jgi:hypothetical protein